MIAFAKTDPAECGPEALACHHGQQRRRKLLLPTRRYRNEPGRLQVEPIVKPDHHLEWFEGEPEFEPSEHYATLAELAGFLAEWEFDSVVHNYPRSCERIHYLTAVQWCPRVVALVAIGSPDWVAEQVADAQRDFLARYVVADAIHWRQRSGCVLLHATWGRDFIRGFQRDAERSLERCLKGRGA